MESLRQKFAVSVYVRNRGAILLVRHKALGEWLPIGGELLHDERPQTGARRKLQQEAGVEGRFSGVFGAHAAIPGAPEGFMGYEEHPAGAKGWHMAFAFRMDVDTRALYVCEQHSEHIWVEHMHETAYLALPRNVAHLLGTALVIK